MPTVFDLEPGDPEMPDSGRGHMENGETAGLNQDCHVSHLMPVQTPFVCILGLSAFRRVFTVVQNKQICSFADIMVPCDLLIRSSYLYLPQIVAWFKVCKEV